MKSKRPLQKVSCGDWHLGWGFGSDNKIGNLSIEIVKDCPINFVWRGSSQGRHGQKFNAGASERFILFPDKIKVVPIKGNAPRWSEIRKAINTLLRENNYPEVADGFPFDESNESQS